MTLIGIVDLLLNVVWWLVVVQFVLSLLITFNVVNTHSDLVAGIWRGINALLDPLLRPIRRIMPDTQPVDFSPMVLIIGLRILSMLLAGLVS